MILRFLILCLFVGLSRQLSIGKFAWRDKCATLQRFPCLENDESWEQGPPCIEYARVCDGQSDCHDGRDEAPEICGPIDKPFVHIPTDLKTPPPEKFCDDGYFKCANDTLRHQFMATMHSTLCIPKRWRCDGEIDCLDGSDEKDCGEKVNCNEFQISCTAKEKTDDGKNRTICISRSWVCDGEDDCADGFDEKDCPTVQPFFHLPDPDQIRRLRPLTNQNCTDDEFKCANGRCIYKNWKCDGHDDCNDNSDETGCDAPVKCNPDTHITCLDTHYCVPKSWRCDGQRDCLDGSDENDCDVYHPYITHADHNTQSKCPSEHEYACQSGECILKIWLCDNDIDCAGGEDENITMCMQRQKEGLAPQYKIPQSTTPRPICDVKHNQFQCVSDGTCISLSLLCDGRDDCSDASDESHTICLSNLTCNDKEFDCYGNGYRCLNYTQVCDKKIDCLLANGKNGADETPELCYTGTERKDGKRDCADNNGGCEHECVTANTGFCQCKGGFMLVNSTRCVDINECDKHYGICAQKCINVEGGHKCACYKDYMLQADGRSCKAKGDDPLLLLVNRENIRQVDLRTKQFESLVDNLTSAIAVDYHMKDQIIVWTDVHHEKIFKCNMKNKSGSKRRLLARMGITNDKDCQVVLASDRVQTPDGIAVDWVHDLVFWTDTGFDTINVLDLHNASHRRTLFDTDLSEPRAIAVDPKMGLLFWTDWGERAKIERAGMNGEERKQIVNSDLTWPNGLALDLLEKRVYWADAKLKRIESCDYNGNDRKVIMQGSNILHHPFSISVFEEKLYWTDWDTEGIHTANKFTGRDHDLLIDRLFGIMSIRVWHSQSQPVIPNRCANTICAHLCLPMPAYNRFDLLTIDSTARPTLNNKKHTYQCLCSDGFDSMNDGIKCKSSKGIIDQSNLIAMEKEYISGDEEVIDELNNPATVGKHASMVFAIFITIVIILAVLGFLYFRRNMLSSAFRNIPVNFDNPIYRHTTTQDDERVFFDEPPGPGPELTSANEYHDEPPSLEPVNGSVVIGHRPFDQGRSNLTQEFE